MPRSYLEEVRPRVKILPRGAPALLLQRAPQIGHFHLPEPVTTKGYRGTVRLWPDLPQNADPDSGRHHCAALQRGDGNREMGEEERVWLCISLIRAEIGDCQGMKSLHTGRRRRRSQEISAHRSDLGSMSFIFYSSIEGIKMSLKGLDKCLWNLSTDGRPSVLVGTILGVLSDVITKAGVLIGK
ncbi:hypothetical protein MRB53_003314 [Persea americana]|uniref:Uncharacterized protein n=1 Tax=Persea americana TaxID=3435 RepID=A0ACC2MWZ6_PERAE|nr:hypothetical protein MRB53_003314 [Persea americana]